MRGARLAGRAEGWWLRIIPADAGSTRTITSSTNPTVDHPRGCGEHYMDDLSDMVPAGSSPRMRGALGLSVFVLLGFGIIPADAGSTWPNSGR